MIPRAPLVLPVLLALRLCAPAPQDTIADPKTYLAGLVAALQAEWPHNRTIDIVCHGHSVPAGYFETPVVDTFNAYPHLLHVALKRRFPHAVINVIVTAIGGEESESGQKRFAKDVLGHNPDLVTIDYGLNDRRIGLERSRRALEAMIDAAKAKGIPVLLLTPTADKRADLDHAENPLVQQAASIRRIAAAKGVGLADSFARFRAHVAGSGKLDDLMSQVNHPNRAGHELVVAELLRWFP